jgi:hypothetical protein
MEIEIEIKDAADSKAAERAARNMRDALKEQMSATRWFLIVRTNTDGVILRASN